MRDKLEFCCVLGALMATAIAFFLDLTRQKPMDGRGILIGVACMLWAAAYTLTQRGGR